MEKLLKLRDEMKEDLLHGSIFPFWEQYTIDHEIGGFYGAVTVDKVIHKDASKGLVRMHVCCGHLRARTAFSATRNV